MTEYPSRLLCVVLFLAACKGATKEEAEAPAKADVAATTTTANREPFTRTIPALGVVVARPDHYASLSAPSATRVARVYVVSGQRIAAGTPLVEFDQSSFGSVLTSAHAALTAAQSAYDRAQRLSAQGIIPRKDAEQATADLAKAHADANAAERSKELSVLRSPITGVVTKLSAVLGAPADAGQVLVEVSDPTGFDVVLSLGPSEVGAILPGAHVRLSSGERSGGDLVGEGRVVSIGAAVDSSSRSVPIRVTMSSRSRVLRLGESLYGEIETSTRSSVVVPSDALVPGEEVGTYKVFVVDAKGIASAREVKVGGRSEDKVEITEGLNGGEKVVTKGAFAVGDSAKVSKPVPAKP